MRAMTIMFICCPSMANGTFSSSPFLTSFASLLCSQFHGLASSSRALHASCVRFSPFPDKIFEPLDETNLKRPKMVVFMEKQVRAFPDSTRRNLGIKVQFATRVATPKYTKSERGLCTVSGCTASLSNVTLQSEAPLQVGPAHNSGLRNKSLCLPIAQATRWSP